MAPLVEGSPVIRRERGTIVVESAPPTARISLEFLADACGHELQVTGDRITLADQVTYRVTGWDPIGKCLLAERAGDRS